MTSWKPAQSFFQKEIRGNLILLNPHDIVRIPECQPRVDGTDKKLVDDYAQDMRDYDAFYADHDPPIQGWQKFPRISCVHDPKVGYILFSGNHRLEAILQVGYAEVEIHYFTGTRQDAIVASKKENASNGKRRTNADKAHVVKSCLLDDELKLWSNRTIAKWCGVTHGTVAKHEESLVKFTSENGGELYTRPTRRKRLSKSGEIEWVETASIGNGNPEKPSRKELKRKHHSAIANVQSAFFTADLHDHESFSHLPHVETGKKAQEFFRRIVAVKVRDVRPDIFATNSSQDFSHEGKDLTNAEIEAEIEVLKKIAGQIRWYGESEEHGLGWIEKVLKMEPEQQETESASPKQQETESPKQSVDRRESGCRTRLREVLREHHKLDSTTYDVGALAKEFELYAVRVEVIARDLVAKEIEKAQSNWQKAWTKVRTAWFDYEELSKSVEWETFTAAVLDQVDMVFLTKDTFENPDNRLNSNDLELLISEKNCLITLGYHIRNPSFWVSDLIPDAPPAAEVVNATESDVISEARSQVSELIEELDAPKVVEVSEKTLSDVLGEDRLAFITVCLREPKPTGVSGKGKLNYITFDAEGDRTEYCIDISEIPEPLLAQLIAIAKEQAKKSAQA